MSIASPFYQNNVNDDADHDDADDFYENNNVQQGQDASNHFDTDDANSDTEEASETEYNSGTHNNRNHGEPLEIKEQMYQDKLSNLKKQLEELKRGTHPEYIRRVKKLENQYKERIRLNEIYREYLSDCVERDLVLETKACIKEFEEKKLDLKENLLSDFEDKRKIIESERLSMELIGDSNEVKPTITRKLRRRPNDPMPVAAEKRRKPPTGQLIMLLDEKEIENDLKIILRGKSMTPIRPPTVATNGIQSSTSAAAAASVILSPADNYPLVETKIEDGKLLYERRWFHRGQPVHVEGKDIPKFAATISAIGNEIIWVKKLSDNIKVKIHTSQLARGKIAIKRRAN